jgi:hypothetical protein
MYRQKYIELVIFFLETALSWGFSINFFLILCWFLAKIFVFYQQVGQGSNKSLDLSRISCDILIFGSINWLKHVISFTILQINFRQSEAHVLVHPTFQTNFHGSGTIRKQSLWDFMSYSLKRNYLCDPENILCMLWEVELWFLAGSLQTFFRVEETFLKAFLWYLNNASINAQIIK